MAESHIEKKEKRDGQRPRKAKEMEEKKRGRRPKKEKKWKWMEAQSAYVCQRHKSEKKMRKAQSAWENKRDVACLVDLDLLYCMHMWWLLVHVIGHLLLSIIHHSLLAFHPTPKVL